MKVVSKLVVLALLAVAPQSAADRGGGDPMQPNLSARDISHYIRPYVAGVRDCYAANATGREADGTLRLELVIEPEGSVAQLGFSAGGVNGAARVRLGRCLRDLGHSWHFPVRRGYTTATVPFVFSTSSRR